MKNKIPNGAMIGLVLVSTFAAGNGAALALPPAQASKFADPAFQRTWERTDMLVAQGKVKRSFYWGPQPNTGALQEEYAEGPGGKHLVQYFDKSRMEINDPRADPKKPFYVTNGLLTVELMTGSIPIGNGKYARRDAAQIPLVGDTDDKDAPTYYDVHVYNHPSTGGPLGTSEIGAVLTTTVKKAVGRTHDARFAVYGVKNVYLEKVTGRAIPGVFWDFLNQTGPVIVDGKERTARLQDPYFYATGYPITNAFWATVKIAGKPGTDVLIQAYERRVLTYVPSAPEGWTVQMGNIGQHYYDWRYKGVGLPANCKPPPGGIGKLWATDIKVHGTVLCPVNSSYEPFFQIQHFERGHMVRMQLRHPPDRNSSPIPNVLVLAPDGTIKHFPDLSGRKPDPDPTQPPPSGLHTPSGEIGKVWRENAPVREQLGSAISPLKDLRPEEAQPFESGLILADGDKIYVLASPYNLWPAPHNWSEYPNPMPLPPPKPVSGCAVVARESMGRLWGENLVLQNHLGCPTALQPEGIAFQPFGFVVPDGSHGSGAMLYLNLKDPPPTSTVYSKVIYALFSTGTVKWFEDTYKAGDPEPTPSIPTPNGYYEPRAGFGKVWREQRLIGRLWYAIAPERSIDPKSAQLFERGLMVETEGQIYVLYRETPGYFADAKYWQRYDSPGQ
ncbi:MAG TPA: hypothetical protein VEX13_16895 [Chloroflexia bacterium]|nr:hypothetical protein [Chloroflexia bacterium]